MKTILFIALIVLAAQAVVSDITPIQYVPIQSNFESRTYGKASNHFQVQLFYDLMCPDSKATNANLNKIFEQIDIYNQDQVTFQINIFPLPYHYNAMTMATGFQYVISNFSNKQLKSYMDYVFSIQDDFVNKQTNAQTQNQIKQNFARRVSQNVDFLQESTFLNALSDHTYVRQAALASKYGLGNQVQGTPWCFAQGVQVNCEDWGYDDWVKFLQQYTDLQF